MNTGIYAITHQASGKVYIGSAVHFEQRWRVHRHHLRKGTHHSQHLQAAWNKHGEPAFAFKKLLVCSKDNLLFYEQRLVDGYGAADRKTGFNVRTNVSSSIGISPSKETRDKISRTLQGRKATDSARANMSAAGKGRKMPDWFPAFMKAQKTGTKHAPEARAKISAAQKGKAPTLKQVEARVGTTLARATEICAEYRRGGTTQLDIAKKYGIDQSAVSLIVRGKRWGQFSNQQEKSK